MNQGATAGRETRPERRLARRGTQAGDFVFPGHALIDGLAERKIRGMFALFRLLSNIVLATALLSVADLAAAQSSSSASTRAVTQCAVLIKVVGQRFPNTTTVITSAQVNAASDAKPGNPAAGPAGAPIPS